LTGVAREREVIVEHGILTPTYNKAASVEAALESGNASQGLAWIGVVDPTEDELARLGRALGASDQSLAEIEDRGESIDLSDPSAANQPARARAEVLDGVVHLLVRGPARDASGNLELDGDIEVLATRTAVVVASRGIAPEYQPDAILTWIAKSLDASQKPAAVNVVGLLISFVFDWYEDVLDEVEREIAEIADELFGERRMEILPRLYALAPPLHGATVAVQPFARGLDRVLRELGAGDGSAENLDWQNDAEHLAVRVARLDSLLVSTLQVYLGRSQDEANALADQRNEITQRMSAYALLLAIPTIIFSIYGTNFKDIWILSEGWGYPVIMLLTVAICLYVYLKLRRAGWL
jgi:magnesium transporter